MRPSVAIGTKQTCGSDQSMSAFGGKQTSRLGRVMSALTQGGHWVISYRASFKPLRCFVLSLGGEAMRRREFIAMIGGAVAWPLVATAQQSDGGRKVRIGLIAAVPPTPAMLKAFLEGMRDRGYIEGQNLAIDVRWPKGTFDQDSGVVTELVKSNVDVIVAWATPTVAAVRNANSTIPIVMVSVGDPVGSGFVASLARPGGNITGVSIITSDLSAKLLGLFVQMIPSMRVIGLVTNSYNPNVAVQLRESQDAVRKLGLRSHVVEARTPEEFERGFARLKAANVDGVVLLSDPVVVEHGKRIAELALAARLPTAFQRRENVEAGGLFSYGGNLPDQFKYAASYVDRILKGAKPADLPVEQPIQFDFTVNLKTAKALELTIPTQLLAAANEVFQ
jgi:putative tryptophan/tyrosine transport system substrate-binding protein